MISEGVASQRLTTSLLASFSLAALLLAAIGLYGVVSYSVAQRTQELGIRAALGAQRSKLVGGVLREGLAFVAVGVPLGAVAARGSAQFIASQLVGITVDDPLVYRTVAVLLATVSVIALLAPAVTIGRIQDALDGCPSLTECPFSDPPDPLARSPPDSVPVAELARAAVSDLLAAPDDDFRAVATRVLRKNQELYRRLA